MKEFNPENKTQMKRRLLAAVSVLNKEYKKRLVFPYVGMSTYPFHPQGFGQHGELYSRYHKRWDEKTINFADLPADCQRLVLQDLKD